MRGECVPKTRDETMSESGFRLNSSSPEETRALGKDLAFRLRRGDCVALFGDLGSGKTCLIQGISAGLQVADAVTSPTFILVNEYLGRDGTGAPLPVFHFDLYRLSGSEDLMDLGWDDYFDRGGIYLVEWADRAEDLLPPHTLSVQIEAPEDRLRIFTLTYGE